MFSSHISARPIYLSPYELLVLRIHLRNCAPCCSFNIRQIYDPVRYINEYNIEGTKYACLLTSILTFSGDQGTGAKATAMINLVNSLKAQNVPIDGIGVQVSAQTPFCSPMAVTNMVA